MDKSLGRDAGNTGKAGFGFGGMEIISVYSNDQAVEDGLKYPVTDIAKNHGFRCPVHITVGVMEFCEGLCRRNQGAGRLDENVDRIGNTADSAAAGSLAGKSGVQPGSPSFSAILHERIRDVILVARAEAISMKHRKDHFGAFSVSFPNKEKFGSTELQKMFIVFDPLEGFTIMLPDEY